MTMARCIRLAVLLGLVAVITATTAGSAWAELPPESGKGIATACGSPGLTGPANPPPEGGACVRPP